MASVSQLLLLALSLIYRLVSCVPQGMKLSHKLWSSQIANSRGSEALASISQSSIFLQSAAPDLAGPTTAPPSCGGCYLVADVCSCRKFLQYYAGADDSSQGRWLGLVFRGVYQYRCDCCGICGRWKWHPRNENISTPKRGSFHFQHSEHGRCWSFDSVELPTDCHCWRS